MKPIQIAPFALGLFLFAVAGCGSDDSSTTGTDTGPFAGIVQVVDNRFVPANVTISAGDSITWRFEGSAQHTVTEGTVKGNPNALFASGLKSSGTFGYRFNSTGSFPYHCEPHFDVNMKGTVTVE